MMNWHNNMVKKDVAELKQALKDSLIDRHQGSISRVIKRQIFDAIENIISV